MPRYRVLSENDSNYALLTEVMNKYECDVNSIHVRVDKGVRAVWIVNSTKGVKYLKRLQRTEKVLRYIIDATMYLRSKGMNIPEICSSKEKQRYVIVDGASYILIDEIKGKRPDNYKDAKQLEAITRELAAFHNASRGYRPPNKCEPFVYLGSWPQEYADRYNRLKWIKANSSTHNREEDSKYSLHYNTFEKMGLEKLPFLLDWASWAGAQLARSNYQHWTQKVREYGGLCHNDFQRSNILIDPGGRVAILDLDTIAIDIPSRDIRNLIYDVMNYDDKFSIETLKNIFAWYQEVNPLTKDEWNVVKIDLLSPIQAIKIMNIYFIRRKQPWDEKEYITRFEKALSSEKFMLSMRKELDNIISEITRKFPPR